MSGGKVKVSEDTIDPFSGIRVNVETRGPPSLGSRLFLTGEDGRPWWPETGEGEEEMPVPRDAAGCGCSPRERWRGGKGDGRPGVA